MRKTCGICQRKLNQSDDPLSIDCGGDCWGCIGEIEAETGDATALEKVRRESLLGLRPETNNATTLLFVQP